VSRSLSSVGSPLQLEDFRQQAEFRHHVRRFLKASEVNSRAEGLEPSQFQLLLAIKGMPEEIRPNVTNLSRRLLIETHSVVELVDRLIQKGMVERYRSGGDKRMVFLRLTEKGEGAVDRIAQHNRQDLKQSLSAFMEFLETLR
jgi:DNA-binding MarR family transcriptional regulator